MTTALRYRRAWRMAGRFIAAVLVMTAVTGAALSLAWPAIPVVIHVRWNEAVEPAERLDLERRFQLAAGERLDGTTWRYQLSDSSSANIRRIVQSARVDDTAHVNRSRYRPAFAMDRSRQIALYSVVTGTIGGILWLLFVTARATGLVPDRSLRDVVRSIILAPWTAVTRVGRRRAMSGRTVAGLLVAALLAAVAMTVLAGAPLIPALGALAAVYVGGYLVGGLLVDEVDAEPRLAWGIIRTVAGLLLTVVAFLLSLVLALPWFAGPLAIVGAAVVRMRRAVGVPDARRPNRPGRDGVVAAVAVIVLVSPILITALAMAPGPFPPVFYNVDTAYFLEKVHALIGTASYPPESLSNAGGVRVYHFGTHAMAALIARASALPAHHSTFLIVLPLLTAGLVAAAVALARRVAPALPYSLTAPLLLISLTSLSSTAWGAFGPHLWRIVTTGQLPADGLLGPHALWGILSNEGQNVGGDFVILGSLAALVAAPSIGGLLAAFLIGTSILVKTTTGVALVAGCALVALWEMWTSRRLWPPARYVGVGAVFVATYVTFWVMPSVEPEFRIEWFPLYHVKYVIERGVLIGVLADALWMFLPVLIVAVVWIRDPGRRSAPLLLVALAPLLIANAAGMMDIRPGRGGPDEDWLQILHPIPFAWHAFALSLASRRWDRLGRFRRAAFLMALFLALAPVVAAAGRYSLVLLRTPDRGNDYADNRPLGEALAVIPTARTVIVTNDLRYPADGFRREERQMQIPALFGHQAFAVNYAYEVYAFSAERRALQTLLQAPMWSADIPAAARAHGWTHLLIRKDYPHPAPIPLQRVFENPIYAVYRFP